jgi:integrase
LRNAARLPPRLYLDPLRRTWVIRDGQRFIRLSEGEGERAAAEKHLAEYIGRKWQPKPSGAPLIADVLNVFSTEVALHRKRPRYYAYRVSHLLEWWGDKTVADVSAKACRAYAEGRPPMQAASDLRILRVAVNYWHREYGPLNFIPSFWTPKNNPPKDRWLTKAEAARLLKASRPYPHLRRMILLGLHTGSRPGVIMALRWDQIDLHAGVMHRLPRGVRDDDKKRSPPVRLGRKIRGHLRRWRRLDGAHVVYVCGYNGRPVADPHGTWHRTLRAAGLTGISRHIWRHTRATWMAQAGVPLWEAAGFLGMTVKTLERVYSHHSPDFQERAANI